MTDTIKAIQARYEDEMREVDKAAESLKRARKEEHDRWVDEHEKRWEAAVEALTVDFTERLDGEVRGMEEDLRRVRDRAQKEVERLHQKMVREIEEVRRR